MEKSYSLLIRRPKNNSEYIIIYSYLTATTINTMELMNKMDIITPI